MSEPQLLPAPERIAPDHVRETLVPWNDSEFRLYPFRYIQNYAKWEFIPNLKKSVGEFVPKIDTVRAVPGCNGTPDPRGGVPSTAKAVAYMERKGYVEIKLRDDRLGDKGDYLRAMPGTGGRRLYCDQFERVEILPNGTAEWISQDSQWMDFRRLVRDKLLPRMSRHAYQAIARIMDDRLQRALAKAERSPLHVESYRELQKVRAQLDATWEAYQAESRSKSAPEPERVEDES